MADPKLTKMLETQISLTEWFESMRHANADAMRAEDNEKRERLKILNQAIGLPFDQPWQFTAQDVAQNTAEFQQFTRQHGDELCALRLIPLEQSLPKMRMRGYSIRQATQWFGRQNIDHLSYRADFIPHPSVSTWSTIFIVNQNGVYGEIIKGGHHQLTQGFHDDQSLPIVFSYDFSKWQLDPGQPDAKAHLAEAVAMLKVDDAQTRAYLSGVLNAQFARNYVCGYFETAASREFGIWFIDYNRILGDLYADFSITPDVPTPSSQLLAGQAGSGGKATGRVRIVQTEDLDSAQIEAGEVLVSDMTTPQYLPLMQQAAAIITDKGGILCHAAIVAREMKKPCIIGTINATKLLKNGDMVEVDGDKGTVNVISKTGAD
ncbi:MAG TPA: PEP-utilizing enzyme [Candidatus Saccharimonadales bacterium]|nr:PEP-utilizing enzyme [Candidatus Saccharimonadales bacterium]